MFVQTISQFVEMKMKTFSVFVLANVMMTSIGRQKEKRVVLMDKNGIAIKMHVRVLMAIFH